MSWLGYVVFRIWKIPKKNPIGSKHNSPEAKKFLHPALSHVKGQNGPNANNFCSSDLFRSSTHSLTIHKERNNVQNIHIYSYNCLSKKNTWFEASTWMGTVVSKCSIAVCTAQNPHKAHAKSCTNSLTSKVVEEKLTKHQDLHLAFCPLAISTRSTIFPWQLKPLLMTSLFMSWCMTPLPCQPSVSAVGYWDLGQEEIEINTVMFYL